MCNSMGSIDISKILCKKCVWCTSSYANNITNRVTQQKQNKQNTRTYAKDIFKLIEFIYFDEIIRKMVFFFAYFTIIMVKVCMLQSIDEISI